MPPLPARASASTPATPNPNTLNSWPVLCGFFCGSSSILTLCLPGPRSRARTVVWRCVP